MEKILTVSDVADILQVKAITVREMFREKRLRGFKVGKAWRTTEAMLQEDIDALARGESPLELPTPDPKKDKHDIPPAAENTTPPNKKPEGRKDSQQREKTKPVADTPKRSPKDTPKNAQDLPDSSAPDDDTQQMLF